MKTSAKLLWIAAASLALAAPGAYAQFTGPGAHRPAPPPAVQGAHRHHHHGVLTTVREVIGHGREDQRVELEGYVVRRLRHEHYVFRDRTGEVVAEIDDDLFRGHRVDERTRVRVWGEVDARHGRQNEIEVKGLQVLHGFTPPPPPHRL